MKELYTRQKELKFKVPRRATVIGCGGTGTWTALFLAMMGTRKLRLIDGDLVSLHNLNRLPYTQKTINRFKVNALNEFISQLRPECEISTIPDKITPRTLLNNLKGMIFDCTDDGKLQAEVFSASKRKKLEYRRVGCDGYHFTVMSDRDMWGTPSNENGYRIVPSCVLTPAIAAALAVMSTQNKKVKVMGNLKEMLNER